MKKIYLFILPVSLFLFGMISPAQTFAQYTGPTCPDSAFKIQPDSVKPGQTMTFTSGCWNWAVDYVSGGVTATNGGPGGIDRHLTPCNPATGTQSDNWTASNTPGTYTWIHAQGTNPSDCEYGHVCKCVNAITFTIGNGTPIPTSVLPTSTLPSVTPGKIPTSTPLPTLAPLPNCYDKLGAISFKKEDSSFETFDVYSKSTAPQTFYIKSQSDPNTYVYTITDATFPSYTNRNSSLQMGNLPFITKNEWTWATPWCKPAIYLYPGKPTNLTVKLNLDGQMTVSNPQYNNLTGWNVRANPDGTIQQLNNLTMKQFPYLYYEADLNNVDIPKNGFVIPQMNLSNQLSSILTTLGFNTTERNDFLTYWLPRLTDRPYYFVTLLPENVINEKETLNLSFWQDEVASRIGVNSNTDPGQARMTTPIMPDTMIRSRFVFEGLDTPIRVDPLSIPSHERKGFTLTDWGGTIVGKSCTDITVK